MEVEMNKFVNNAIEELTKYCKKLNIDDSHGVDHVLRLLTDLPHVYQSHLDSGKFVLSNRIYLNVALAIILHDVDDKKFVNSVNYSNAREILKTINWCVEDDVSMIIEMISKVGMSENGCFIDDYIPEWMYWPRHLDRIDALGYIGIKRIYHLTNDYLKTPMFIDGVTPLLLTHEEVLNAARKSRYVELCQESVKNGGKKYSSISGIDHMIEGIIPRTFDVIHTNKYIEKKYKVEVEIIIQFVIEVSKYRKNYGGTSLNLAQIEEFEVCDTIH